MHFDFFPFVWMFDVKGKIAISIFSISTAYPQAFFNIRQHPTAIEKSLFR